MPIRSTSASNSRCNVEARAFVAVDADGKAGCLAGVLAIGIGFGEERKQGRAGNHSLSQSRFGFVGGRFQRISSGSTSIKFDR